MSVALYVLVVLQGASGLTFSPGHTTATECMQHTRGRTSGPPKADHPRISEKLIWESRTNHNLPK